MFKEVSIDAKFLWIDWYPNRPFLKRLILLIALIFVRFEIPVRYACCCCEKINDRFLFNLILIRGILLVNKFGENARDLLNVGYLLRQLYMWCSLVKSESAYCTKCLASCSGILVLFGMVQSLFALTVTSTKKSQISYCRSLYNHMLCSIIWTLLIHLKVWVHGFLRD